MSTTYEATGTIVSIMDTQQVSDTFKKREFAIEIPDGQYPQSVKFQLVQDKTALLDNYAVGQQVKVFFNLRGREYTRKNDGSKDYWVSLDCWRLERLSGGAAPSGTDYSQIPSAQVGGSKDEFDDVPF